MKKQVLLGAGVAGAVGTTFAEGGVADIQSAATTAITAVESAVIAVLVAGIVITIAMWSYGKIKAALRKN